MNTPAKFSQRQLDFFKRAMHSWLNIAEGGKRGGKNVLVTMIFCSMLETHPNKIHLVAGVSVATAKLNILDCDGMGMLNYFEGRCREGKYKDRDCLYVRTKTGEKVVLVSGGGKDGDEKLIKGNTYGMVYVTEANECHPKFIKETFDRTVSSADRKIFHDLNPKAPDHPYYVDILSFHERMQGISTDYGYNYGHFTLCDNMSLSDETIRKVLSTYDKGSVWYERDIRGARIVAEGIIFRKFAENPEPHLLGKDEIFDAEGHCLFKWSKLVVGLDFGGNGSKTTMVLNGYLNGYKNFVILEEDGLPLSEDIDADAICNRFCDFIVRCQETYGHIDWVFPDSASTTLINSLVSAARKNNLNIKISGCRKNEVADRPRTMDMLLNTDRIKIATKCENVIRSLCNLRWDEKKPDIPEDKNLGNINDWWDAIMYTMLDFIEYIDLER